MRSFIFFTLFSTLLFSKESIEVFAKHVAATVDFFEASGDVVILYDNTLLKAKHATYDKKTSLLTLDGDVEMLGKKENRVASEYLVIDTAKKSVNFKELFLATEDDLWIAASKAKRKGERYEVFNSKLSSCNKSDPDWTIDFKEAVYRKDKNYITLKDASLTFFDKKIFSFPYLMFPTIDTRTTGLLFPKFRLSTTDGLIYQQPYFYAPKENIDIEFNPQIQLLRGLGIHATTRFVDSNHSSGSFTTGYFKNFESYTRSEALNKEHYGLEFLYSSTDFLPTNKLLDKYQNGLYINATYLNDLEYLNLQKDSASSLIKSNLIESRLNAFVYDEKRYLGFYSKYYIDMSKENNKDTLQELPTLHFHNYMDKFLSNKAFYTFDVKLHNYTRLEGSRGYQAEIDLPITYDDSFFNDYVDFSLSENLYLSHVSFSNLDIPSKSYSFYRNFHTMELSSDLIKEYDGNIHTLHPSIVYIKPSFEKENPVEYRDLHQSQQELFVTQTEKEKLSFGVSQYYYDNELDVDFYHRLSWTKFPKENLNRGDINNEFGYDKDSLKLYSSLLYSLDEEKIHSLTNTLSYNQSNYDIMLTHFYNNDFVDKQEETSFMSASFIQNYDSHNRWFVDYDYDLKKSFNHQWHLGWTHKQKCWGATLSLGQEEIPNVESSFRNNMLYFELNLNPLGGISQNIEQEFSSQGR